jgi:protein SCO1/2
MALLLVLGLGAGWLVWSQHRPVDAGPLHGAAIGGAFALTDQDGRAVTDQSYKGQYLLVYFGYTYCPDVCPIDTQRMAMALRAFETVDPVRAAKVTPLFITVDPERDTPTVLKAFVSAFHPRLVGLTGTPTQIDRAKRAYRIFAQKSGAPGGKDYLVDHIAVLYLMGPDGAPISFFARDSDAKAITADLDRYVR